MKWSELAREPCSIARTISVVGDRWTLLILRDCFLRVRRFEDLQSRLGITRPILADRLRKLVREGLLEKVPYQESPTRHEYRLTERGRAFHPVLLALVRWGDDHMAGDAGPPNLYRHKTCGHDFRPETVCSACGEPVSPRDVEVRPAPGRSAAETRLRPSEKRGTTGDNP